MTEVTGKRIVVVGLGRSGQALAQFLIRRGALVVVTDQKSEVAFEPSQLEALRRLGVQLELGGHRMETLLSADMILLSPGVPPGIEPIRRARDAGIPLLGEVEWAWRFLKGRMVGVTGSNGKTTVTSLIGAILSQAGFDTLVGGNIGLPLTALIDRATDESVLVVELSSFQLETAETLRPHVAVMTNISPDHLDRHGSLSAYINAKRRIFLNQTRDDWAVLNADDPIVLKMMYDTQAQPIVFSRRRELDEGVFLMDERLVYRFGGQQHEVMKVKEIPLRGWHNVENVMAAVAASMVMGAPVEMVRQAVLKFPGVPHRLEWVGEVDGVMYYNDSKATNVDSAVKALEAFTEPLVVIMGGRSKGSSYEPLRPLVQARVKHLLLLGEAAPEMATALAGTAPLTLVGSMAEAVEQAHRLAQPGDVVLLAPACASFDMFENFEHRGDVFKEQVRRLKVLGPSSSRLDLRIE
ncbi:MAG: UDP-N-acetylmuramoyl-L-alanine--D-glutamate ligase [Acidobacteriota bacterium]|nr:UDP-N-acetylmuramoyl-L-alanine--D-glutamate ligase [Blastocatellia bacterium]MDW8238077.1 UDP-N-acetylmuramoyl-L-alanine--D-glutamate ligase [Acidobacteriota bacterium]